MCQRVHVLQPQPNPTAEGNEAFSLDRDEYVNDTGTKWESPLLAYIGLDGLARVFTYTLNSLAVGTH